MSQPIATYAYAYLVSRLHLYNFLLHLRQPVLRNQTHFLREIVVSTVATDGVPLSLINSLEQDELKAYLYVSVYLYISVVRKIGVNPIVLTWF